MEDRVLIIYFDEKYYDICRLVFDHYWHRPNVFRGAFEARRIEGDTFDWAEKHQEEWIKITGVYAGEDGKILYLVKERNVKKVLQLCELLKESGILKEFQI